MPMKKGSPAHLAMARREANDRVYGQSPISLAQDWAEEVNGILARHKERSGEPLDTWRMLLYVLDQVEVSHSGLTSFIQKD